MALKIKGKVWDCRIQCGSNCCSEIFLPLNKAQKQSIEEKHYYIVDANYNDFRWLKFHKALNIIKTGNKGERKIEINEGVEYEFKKHPLHSAYMMLYVQDKCSMLLKNNKCKVFRNRPDICKKALCIVFSDRAKINWYGKNGLLKDKVEAYKKGELKKW